MLLCLFSSYETIAVLFDKINAVLVKRGKEDKVPFIEQKNSCSNSVQSNKNIEQPKNDDQQQCMLRREKDFVIFRD